MISPHHFHPTNGVRPADSTLHISDEIEEKASETGILDIRTYRKKVIDYLAEHILSPVVDKIRRLEPNGAKDMAELENILWNVLGTKEQYDAEKYKGSLLEFVREIVDYLRANGEVTPDNLTNDVPFVNYDIGSLFEDRIGHLREIIARLNKISGSEAA